ncbi:hypothetical protein GCM10022247_35750 [Allokutzneria multivorans]|uniref:Uncharacterized protein n=2 Tax=Allokutzneria multivorans TaxID=1142134 RepID=A0ABP7SDN9_9PSEU
MPTVSVVAAAEAGVVVERMPLVPRPGDALGAVVDALVDGMDVVAVAGLIGLRPQEIRKVTARARQRGTVLMSVHAQDRWPGADLELRLAGGRWRGLGAGHGHLLAREVEVRASGRGAAARPRSTSALLPGPGGLVAEATVTWGRGAAAVVGPGCA